MLAILIVHANLLLVEYKETIAAQIHVGSAIQELQHEEFKAA